jgi:hypothetical protein
MTKTTFSSGVIVTSAWLNGAQQIYFDGQEIDWHYNPLGLNSLITTGSNGLDTRYITLGTDQPYLSSGLYVSGSSISGSKVVTGVWNFGYDTTVVGNPTNSLGVNAPKSFTTNTKYLYANNVAPLPAVPTTPQKFAALSDEDLVTKLVLSEQVEYLVDNLEVDNGYYATTSGCNNYSSGSSVICTP